MRKDDINNAYFEWLYELVCKNRFSSYISYRKLLMYLHNKEFRWLIPMDSNRADDGISLRYRFACECIEFKDAELYLQGPCSVLEMMIALAIRGESIMDDPQIGDRTPQWFWIMVTNLGLGAINDARFDKAVVEEAVEKFLDRDYEPDGTGGLFRIRNCEDDVRSIEIWHQLCWYFDNIS